MPRFSLACLVLFAVVGAGSGSARAACPSTGATLLQTAAKATEGYQARDKDAVKASVDELRSDLLCVATVLDPAQAAAVHRALALSAFLDGNTEVTRQAFHAARLADSSWTLPTSLAPEGHPLRAAWDASASLADGAMETLGQRSDRRTWVDGRPGTQRPSDRPAVLQADLLDGTMVGSTYLMPGETLPSWAQVSAVAVSADPPSRVRTPPVSTSTPAQVERDRAERVKPDREKKGGPNRGLLFTGLGVGAASGALWGAAVLDGLAYERHTGEMLDREYVNPAQVDEGQQEIDAHWRRVNMLGYAAQATSAAGGLLLVTSFVF